MRHDSITSDCSKTVSNGVKSANLTSLAWVFGLGAVLVTAAGANSQASGVQLNAGDIVYADSGDGISGGFVLKVDPATGAKTVVASGGFLRMPYGVVVDSNGQIMVSDSGRLIHIDPNTQIQTVIPDNSLGKLGSPYGIEIDPSGEVLAANAQSVVRFDPASGQANIVSSGANFTAPLGVAVADNGGLLVVNAGTPGQVVRVNPQNGGQKVLASGLYLNSPRSIAVAGNDIYVTDVFSTNINYGVAGRVIHIDAHTGAQTVVSAGQLLVDPVGIAIDSNGQIIVADASTVNAASPDLSSGGYDGCIIRIDPATGAQTPLSRGQGSCLNPQGVAVVPVTVSKH